jgi:hypothetical protein
MELRERLADLIGKKLEVELPGTTTTLTIMDWEALTLRSYELTKQAQRLPRKERGDFYSSHPDRRSEIFEYFLDEASEDEVEKGRWIPFGVLGLGHAPENFAETGHDGLLVLEPGKGKEQKVLWVRGGDAWEVAERLEELKIIPVAEPVKVAKNERHL